VRRTLRPEAKEGQPRFRFNWNAPFFISPHEPTTLYLGGNCVFKLTERGDHWRRISDDLSTRDVEKIVAVGSQAETGGTVVSLAESVLQAGLLWAGTDDGLVHVTFDDGGTWAAVTPPQVNGLYVSKIEPSHHDRETAYVAVDGHRSDVFEPILLMTADAGRTWTSIVGDLPGTAPPDVVREDLVNPEVLYVGTEQAAYVTIDRGAHWVKLNGKSLPTAPVEDLVIHPREHDLVAGTHGRSIWILDDISPLSREPAHGGGDHLLDPRVHGRGGEDQHRRGFRQRRGRCRQRRRGSHAHRHQPAGVQPRRVGSPGRARAAAWQSRRPAGVPVRRQLHRDGDVRRPQAEHDGRGHAGARPDRPLKSSVLFPSRLSPGGGDGRNR
jgi:hypothetical protein